MREDEHREIALRRELTEWKWRAALAWAFCVLVVIYEAAR